MPKHSPTPWHLSVSGLNIADNDNEQVAMLATGMDFRIPGRENAEWIVDCVNACEDLNGKELKGLKLARLLFILRGYVLAYRALTQLQIAGTYGSEEIDIMASAIKEADILLETIDNLLAEDKD